MSSLGVKNEKDYFFYKYNYGFNWIEQYQYLCI